jgi:hypothetical protein
MNMLKPRQPNAQEIDQIRQCLAEEMGVNYAAEKDWINGLVDEAAIAVFDDYQTFYPSGWEKVIAVIWPISPRRYAVFTPGSDGTLYRLKQATD